MKIRLPGIPPQALLSGILVLLFAGGAHAELSRQQTPAHTDARAPALQQNSQDQGTPNDNKNLENPAVEQEQTTKPTNTSTSPNPQKNRQLIISQTSILLYKKDPGATRGIKDSALVGVSFSISTSDGQKVRMPQSTGSPGVITSTSQGGPDYKSSWPMVAYPSYAQPGSENHLIEAFTSSGIRYTGSIQVTVKQMPLFDIDGDGLIMYATSTGSSNGLYFDDGRPAYFDFSAVTGFMPTLAISDGTGTRAGADCTVSLTSLGDVPCGAFDDALTTPGTYYFRFTFENQFQRIELPTTVVVD